MNTGLFIVMAGLVPAIHAIPLRPCRFSVDARIKSTAVRYIFCCTECTALIPLGPGRVTTVRTGAGVNAMRHENTVFHELLKHIPWPAFDRLVAQHRADARARRLTTKSQFVALLYGQLSGLRACARWSAAGKP